MTENKFHRDRRISLQNDFYNKQVDDILYGMMSSLATARPKQGVNGKICWEIYLTEQKYNQNRDIFYCIDAINNKKQKSTALRNHLQKLINQGLIKKGTININGKDCKCFYFPFDIGGAYYIIDKYLLQYISDTKKTMAVWIFVYLADRMKYINETKGSTRDYTDLWSFSATQIAKKIGYSEYGTGKGRPIQKITGLLIDMRKCHLIDYSDYDEKVPGKNGGYTIVKKKRLLNVATKLTDVLTKSEILDYLGEEQGQKVLKNVTSVA